MATAGFGGPQIDYGYARPRPNRTAPGAGGPHQMAGAGVRTAAGQGGGPMGSMQRAGGMARGGDPFAAATNGQPGMVAGGTPGFDMGQGAPQLPDQQAAPGAASFGTMRPTAPPPMVAPPQPAAPQGQIGAPAMGQPPQPQQHLRGWGALRALANPFVRGFGAR